MTEEVKEDSANQGGEAEAPKEEKKTETPKAPEPAKVADAEVKTTFSPKAYEKPKQGVIGKLFGKSKLAGNEYINDGNTLLAERNFEAAAAAFETALSGDPKLLDGYIGLAKSLSGLGAVKNTKAAIEYLYKALEIEYDKESVYDLLVKLYQNLGDVKRAQRERKKLQTVRIIKSDPANSIANNNLGVMQLAQKQYEGAIRSFEKAKKGQMSNSVSQFNLANTWLQKASEEKDPYDKKNQLAKAYAEVETYMRQEPSANGMLLKARIFMVFGDYNKAQSACDEAIKLDSTCKECLNTKVVISEKLGNISDASSAFDDLENLKKNSGKK